MNNTNNAKGTFYDALLRNNDQIKRDRALALYDTAATLYRREAEDLALKIKHLKVERDAMLDLSPTSADSLQLAKDFDAKAFVKRELDLAIELRNLEIKHQLAEERLHTLFGKTEREK